MDLRGRAEPVELGVVAVLSLIATAPLFLFDPGISQLVGGEVGPLLTGLTPLLLLLPLPAAYVATISRHRFRVEALGALVTLPMAFLGLKFAAFSLGIILGLLLVSYKTRSIYKGDNQFWTFFKASAAAVTVLAIVLGLTAAYAYQSSPDLREDIQGNLTDTAVDTATGFIDLSQQGLTSESLTGTATDLAEDVSRNSISLTEQAVFTAVNSSGNFSDGQKQLLRAAFTESKDTIPAQLRDQAQGQVSEQLGGTEDVESELIESRTRPLVEEVSRPTLPVLAVIFFTLLSIAYLFKFPVALLGGIYGKVIYRVKHRSGEEQRRQTSQRRGERRR